MRTVLPPLGKTKFNAKGTIKVLKRIELQDGEHINLDSIRGEK